MIRAEIDKKRVFKQISEVTVFKLFQNAKMQESVKCLLMCVLGQTAAGDSDTLGLLKYNFTGNRPESEKYIYILTRISI